MSDTGSPPVHSLSDPPPLDAVSLLHRVNAELVRLRRALSHDHGDTAFWEALALTPPAAQWQRGGLKILAHRLHIERANSRGRIHGRVFATLAEQGAWLAAREHQLCPRSSRAAGLPDDTTLARLRAGLVRPL